MRRLRLIFPALVQPVFKYWLTGPRICLDHSLLTSYVLWWCTFYITPLITVFFVYNVHFLQYWLLRWFPPSHSVCLGSVPGLFVWDLWWTEWHWVKLFCEYTAFSLCTWCHQCSMWIYSSVTDAVSWGPWLMHLRTRSKGIMLWGKDFPYNVS
jgi:hypothetical protein